MKIDGLPENENKMMMRLLKILIAGILIWVISMPACPGLLPASSPSSPPAPPVKIRFDVSKRDSWIVQEFAIGSVSCLQFELRFEYFNQQDFVRVLKLVGDESRKFRGKDIPVNIKIYRLIKNSPPEIIFEDTVQTENNSGNGLEHSIMGGYVSRLIMNFQITTPGRYLVEASTTKNRPSFAGTPTCLYIRPVRH